MKHESNNIFRFAKSELSQDAFISYCLNFYNTKDIILKNLSIELINMFLKDVNNVDFEKEKKILIYQQEKNIDVLVILPKNNVAIIIEDKIETSEHNDQISTYKEIILKLAEIDNRLGISESVNIITVYFKTGFINDYDIYIQNKNSVNTLVERKNFLEILEKYINYDTIIKSYYNYMNEYDNNESRSTFVQKEIIDENGNEISHWNWNIAQSSVCQQKLMRDIFPNEEGQFKFTIINDEFWENYVWSGTSFGRPFTEMDIYHYSGVSNNDIDYYIFWRIDTDTKGPYLALRMYSKYKKSNSLEKEDKNRKYEKLREMIKKLFESLEFIDYDWNSVRKYKEGNGDAYESTIIHFTIKDLLTKWNTDEKTKIFKSKIRDLTKSFIKNMNEK